MANIERKFILVGYRNLLSFSLLVFPYFEYLTFNAQALKQ